MFLFAQTPCPFCVLAQKQILYCTGVRMFLNADMSAELPLHKVLWEWCAVAQKSLSHLSAFLLLLQCNSEPDQWDGLHCSEGIS